MKRGICVISITYKNPKEQILRLEKSLIANGIKKKDIFFADNEKDNVGYGEGINRIVRKQLKNYEYFFILNPDIFVHKDCIKKLLRSNYRNTKRN